VDDEPAHGQLLEQSLQVWGFTNVVSTTDPHQVLPLYQRQRPDLIVLDLRMPGLDGFQVMEQLQHIVPTGDYLPILVVSAEYTPQARRKALSMGARDFLTKPYDLHELLLRITNMLELRLLHRYMESQTLLLEESVRERTQALEQAQLETLERLALAGEYRDDDTGLHTQRVGKMAAQLAWCLGLAGEFVSMIRRAAPLHDVGKIAIADGILLKAGALDDEEWATMKGHTTKGAAMLAGSQAPSLQCAEEIAITHHERWDGSGYPAGLVGDAIPMAGRLVAVADVFDALTHERPYKAAWPIDKAIHEIQAQSGRQFDPLVIEAFLTLKLEEPLQEQRRRLR